MIRILEDQVINRIAAGEVVARPASALKELVENSLDAGAQVLRIALRAGGQSLIQVVDDGCGMSHDDAMMCLERHATSKIRVFEDLEEVRTLGFRGEALPSIAAVSRFELVTRPHASDVGVRVDVEGGHIRAVEAAGAPVGTRISVRSLFYNVPARRKFLRTVPTELGHCLEAITRMALVHPEVDFDVTHNGKSALRAPRAETPSKRASNLLGAHGKALLPVDFGDGVVSVSGLISPLGVHRASARGSSYLYVNGRFVQDLVVRRAVAEAYREVVPKGRFPVLVLNIRLPPPQVDVNVHPAKTEVRFRNAREVASLVAEGLRAALDAGIPKSRVVGDRSEHRPPHRPRAVHDPQPLRTDRPAPPRPDALPEPGLVSSWSPRRLPDPVVAEPVSSTDGVPTSPLEVARRSGGRLPVPRFADLRVIGQLARTYILAEGAGELVIIDQRTAHERVLRHRLEQSARMGGREGPAPNPPVIVELPVGPAGALEARLDQLAACGLEVESFGERTFAVKRVPPEVERVDIHQLLGTLADAVSGGGVRSPQSVRATVLRTMARLACIQAGQLLSPYESRELLRTLDEVEDSSDDCTDTVCIRMSPSDLGRRFGRH